MKLRAMLPAKARVTLLPVMAASVLATAAAQATTVDCNNIWQRTGSGWYESNPTYTDPRNDTADFILSTPQAEGMSQAVLDAGASTITNGNPSVKSLLVLRNGKLAYERYFNGATRSTAHNIHSASKTLLALLVGKAVEQGYIPSIDTKVSTILPEYFTGANNTTAKKNITIRHLMTMSFGLEWVEDGEEDEDGNPQVGTEYDIDDLSDWVQGVLSLPVDSQSSGPGTFFHYSTGATHVLSGVLQRATGVSTCQFAHDQLLNTMNITAEHWGRDPQAVYSGGYNVYMTAREMAKLGLLMINQGSWNGTQLVPSSTITGIKTPAFADGPTYSYGQLAWLRNAGGHDVYIAWGHGGQFIYVIPSLNIVYVSTQGTRTTDGNDQAQRQIGHERFVDQYLIPATANGGACPAGFTQYSGSLTQNASYYAPSSSGSAANAGLHSGRLIGPGNDYGPDVDFDLYLQKKSSSGTWSNVAQGTSVSSIESADHNGTAATYRWRVHAYEGSGAFRLCAKKP